MANSPELQHSRVPRFALAATVITSLASFHTMKPAEELTPKYHSFVATETLIKIDAQKYLGSLAMTHHVTIKPTLAQQAASEVSPLEFAQWSKVNICEEGGNWHVTGPKFYGGLGITNYNWSKFGGTKFAPNASTATPAEQIIVGEHIQPNPPDQNGCQTNGW